MFEAIPLLKLLSYDKRKSYPFEIILLGKSGVYPSEGAQDLFHEVCHYLSSNRNNSSYLSQLVGKH